MRFFDDVYFGTGIRRRFVNSLSFLRDKGVAGTTLGTGRFANFATFEAFNLVIFTLFAFGAETLEGVALRFAIFGFAGIGLKGVGVPAPTASASKSGVCTVTDSINFANPPVPVVGETGLAGLAGVGTVFGFMAGIVAAGVVAAGVVAAGVVAAGEFRAAFGSTFNPGGGVHWFANFTTFLAGAFLAGAFGVVGVVGVVGDRAATFRSFTRSYAIKLRIFLGVPAP